MSAVSQENRKTKSEVMTMIADMQHIDVNPEVLLMIDYAFHNTDNDYDDGLSFLNRLHSKLSEPFHLQWNLPNLKQFIRSSNNPSQTFLDVLNEILSDEMIVYYGV
jgi:hypothetical protein